MNEMVSLVGSVATILSVAASVVYYWLHRRHDIPVFVHDGHGQPARGVHLQLESGSVVQVDEAGNAVLPNACLGKPVSVRECTTGKQVKVCMIPKIAEPCGAFEIVLPAAK